MINETHTPALDFLLFAERGGFNPWEHSLPGTPFTPPYECCDCPFGVPDTDYGELTRWSVTPNDINPSDPGEGHWACSLLDKKGVWGESPICTVEDWQTKARQELTMLKDLPPPASTDTHAGNGEGV